LYFLDVKEKRCFSKNMKNIKLLSRGYYLAVDIFVPEKWAPTNIRGKRKGGGI